MNFGDLEVRSVNQHPHLERVSSSDIPVTPIQIRLERDRSISATTSSRSQAATVIRWSTPPLRAPTPPLRAPTPPQRTPDTFESFESYYHLSSEAIESYSGEEDYYDEEEPYEPEEAAYGSPRPLVVRFDEEQVRNAEQNAARRELRMPELQVEPSPPTPVDDTPYIRYAIDQLTREEEESRGRPRRSSGDSNDSYSVERIIPDEGLGYVPPSLHHTRGDLALARKHRSSPGEGHLFNYNATKPLSDPNHLGAPVQNLSPDFDIFIPVHNPPETFRHSDLTHASTILRPLAMMLLSICCILMIAALMYCAIYSNHNNGLTTWDGLYTSKYFVFGFLPQFIAGGIFLYVQSVVAAMTRILPFTLMAMEDAEKRNNALFLGIFPRTMLWPRWDGHLAIDLANSFFWLTIFTIPLLSSLFSVIQVNGVWRWVTVQGVAWTLVAIYSLVLLSTLIVAFYFFGQTGLMWEPRCLADIFALLPRSNSLRDYYPGTDAMTSKHEIKDRLEGRSDRLGWWRTPNQHQGIFYCLGETGAVTRRYTLDRGKLQEKPKTQIHQPPMADVEKTASLYSHNTRFHCIPWYLRDTYVILWCVTAFILLLALFIVSFLPSTAIQKGFTPLVHALADSAGFSPANFLYSFIPSILGMLLYLLFQPLDMAIRKITPWSELSNANGARAADSLLLEYTAQSFVTCPLHALRHRHYRVAALSLLSSLFILLPILAGGLFFPLTTPYGVVRMIANLPSFYIILTLLILYFLALLLLIPNRTYMQLPHPVDCLAEIISFVYASELLDDAAFRAPRSKADLVKRLNVVPARGRARRYAFGVYIGRHGKECLGIERLGRRGAQDVMILSGR